VADPGNGASAGLAATIFEKANLEVLPINNEPNGLFPGRGAEPKAETLGKTIGYLRKTGADIAVCFDGDADRVVFCDKKGFIGYNEAIAFISRLKILRSRKKKVVTTVETGRLLDLSVKDVSGIVVRTKVGDVNVAYATRKEDAAIGVEPAGHYIMPEMGYYPDSIYSSLFLLSGIEEVGEIREFFGGMPPLRYETHSIGVRDYLKDNVMNILRKKYITHLSLRKINTLDGLRLEFEDSWMLIRPSGTEPLIRITVEAEDRGAAENVMSKGIEVVNLAKKEACK
jgi:phosphoglucosamine mutase